MTSKGPHKLIFGPGGRGFCEYCGHLAPFPDGGCGSNLIQGRTTGALTGVGIAIPGGNSVSIDGILSPVNIKSPTNTGSDDHLIKKGFALFIRKPLSLNTAAVAKHPMLVNIDDLPFCISLGSNDHVGVLPLDETEYYAHFSRYSLSGIKKSTLRPGNKKTAGKLFPGAFEKKCSVSLPPQCQPEFATRVKEPARAASGGEMKPIEEVAMEELFMYTAIGMSDSYFSSKSDPDHRLFYKSPPIGCGTLGAGPMGMLFAAEWIGVIFFSIISQPFYAGSENHKAALGMFDMIESSRDVSNPLRIPRDLLLSSNPTQKLGVAWGVMDDGFFIKIIEAPFLLKKQKASRLGDFNKGDHKYLAILGEEACKEANWPSNSVFFYHLYKVMAVWRSVWETECDGDDVIHRDVFVPVDLLFGEFSVCLRSPYVGTKDAAADIFSDANHDLLLPIIHAVLWLARTWQLLYIDLRPPNLRVSSDDGRIHLVDYDDMVILKEKPCCDYRTVCTMRNNEHVRKVFLQYKKLAELFEDAGMSDVCNACALERAEV